MRRSIHTHRYRYRYLDYLGRAGRGVEGGHVEALAGVGMDGRRVVLVAVDDGGKELAGNARQLPDWVPVLVEDEQACVGSGGRESP